MASHRQCRFWCAGLTGIVATAAAAVTIHATVLQSGARADRPTGADRHLTVYCGRAESLLGGIIEQFQAETGIEVRVKYGKTGPLAATILEEGRRSPADVFLSQDPGGLGVLAASGRLGEMPGHILDRVGADSRDPKGQWVGITGRLRTLCCSTERVASPDLPNSVYDLTGSRWRGRVGWAPSNASFQAFITAMRKQHGIEATDRWIRAMMANGTRTYPGNMPIIQAIADGEIDIGLVNHYYLHRFVAERGGDFPAVNHVPAGADGRGDVCGAMLVSGAAILSTAPNRAAAERFIEFLLSDRAQSYFAAETFEYPLAAGAPSPRGVPELTSLPSLGINYGELDDLEETVALLRRAGALR
jgi:iron(III) transport system substrate-binding protein